VTLSGIGKRYAVALFNAARNQEVAEQVYGDITSFAALFESDRGFRSFLLSPMVHVHQKKDLVHEVISERASGLFVKFVTLLIDKKRLGKIREIADAYTFLFEQYEGIVEVNAVTAIPLDHDLQLKTRQVLEGRLGKQVRLVTKTDPRIIGGMILLAQDKIIDGSIRNQLESTRKALQELKVH
jgi:F-type H+-transporting ATPase subunit delta